MDTHLTLGFLGIDLWFYEGQEDISGKSLGGEQTQLSDCEQVFAKTPCSSVKCSLSKNRICQHPNQLRLI